MLCKNKTQKKFSTLKSKNKFKKKIIIKYSFESAQIKAQFYDCLKKNILFM